MSEGLVAIVGIVGVFGSTSFLAYVILAIFRARYQAKVVSEFQQKLLDRAGSAADLAALLSTEGGARLLASLSPGARTPHQRMLGAVQAGAALLAVGLGLFVFLFWRALPDGASDVAALAAVIATALGVGLLAAAYATYRLSRHLGLLDDGGAAR